MESVGSQRQARFKTRAQCNLRHHKRLTLTLFSASFVLVALPQIGGLVSLLQLDARSLKSAQRRELSSEKEYKLLSDVAVTAMAGVIKSFTMEEGFEVESIITATSATSKPPKSSGSSSNSSSAGGSKAATPSSLTNATHVHLLFSKKLSRGELMLLDRLQNHM